MLWTRLQSYNIRLQGNQQTTTMIYLPVLVGFLLVLTAEARVGNSSQLQFCSETEQCLLFDPVCENGEYEVRRYEAVKWVTTEDTSYFMEIAAMRAFRRLFNYIRENNVEMTSPVIMKIPVKSFWQMGVYKMGFLLPAEHQKNPPTPTDETVVVEVIPKMKVYVKSFGGWLTGSRDSEIAESLASVLDLAGAKYNKKFHYAVGYNSPMTIFNRHNEVWYVVEGDPECASSEELEFSAFS